MARNCFCLFLIINTIRMIAQDCNTSCLYFFFTSGDYCVFEENDMRERNGMLEITNKKKIETIVGKKVRKIVAIRDCREIQVSIYYLADSNLPPLFYVIKFEKPDDIFSWNDFYCYELPKEEIIPEIEGKVDKIFYCRLWCSEELIDFLFHDCIKLRGS